MLNAKKYRLRCVVLISVLMILEYLFSCNTYRRIVVMKSKFKNLYFQSRHFDKQSSKVLESNVILAGIQNWTKILQLFKFIDSYMVAIRTMECIFIHSIISLFYVFHIQNVTSFSNSVVVNFNKKLKIYVYLHGSNKNNLKLHFPLKIMTTRRETSSSL